MRPVWWRYFLEFLIRLYMHLISKIDKLRSSSNNLLSPYVDLICGLRYSGDSSGAPVASRHRSTVVCISHPIPREINITFRKTLIFSGDIKLKYNISVKVTLQLETLGCQLTNNSWKVTYWVKVCIFNQQKTPTWTNQVLTTNQLTEVFPGPTTEPDHLIVFNTVWVVFYSNQKLYV